MKNPPDRNFVPDQLDRVFVKDRGSGIYHLNLRDERGRQWSQMACRIEGPLTEVAEIPAVPRALLCNWCFPAVRT